MGHPVIALIWQSWRLSRRWYLWVLVVAIAGDLFIMSRAAAMMGDRPGMAGLDVATVHGLLAQPVVMLNFALAIFTTLLAVSIGSKSGFPLTFEFRLPINTPVLVAVPMLVLAALCASLYFLPILLCRLLYGIPLPLLPAVMLLGTLVVILLSCSWATTSTTSRAFAIMLGIFNSLWLFAVLDPVNLPKASREMPRFDPGILALTPMGYGVLAFIALVLFGIALASIRRQRRGEETALLQLPRTRQAQQSTIAPRIAAAVEWMSDLVTPSCPTASPLRAELWLELKRQVMPVLLLSVPVAALIPLVFALGITPDTTFTKLDYVFPLSILFGGVGIATFNRRLATFGYMSAFEGTRGMTTLSLTLLQLLALAGGILSGIALVCVSLHLSSQGLDEPGELAMRLQALLSPAGRGNFLLVLSTALMQLVMFVSAVALLACVHTWAVVWGRVLPYGAGIVAIYGAIKTVSVVMGSVPLEEIKRHIWGFALGIFALTLLALGRTLQRKILSPRAGLVALLCWGLFLACSLYSLASKDIVLPHQAPELQALNAALLLLPLTLFILLLWSYDRLRHR